jgi:hypothetical protein
MRRTAAFFLAFALPVPTAVNAQPAPQSRPTESVTVTGIKPSREVIEDFIFSHTAPTRLLGKLARWKTPICPETMGIRPEYSKFVSQHMRDIAAKVGAPVNADKNCKPNIRAVFTTTPQELMDNLRLNKPLYLGYYESRVQLAEMAKFTRPMQAWYTTATTDLRGNNTIDSNKPTGLTVDYQGITGTDSGGMSIAPSMSTLNLGNATIRNVTGNRLNDGVSSTFFNVLIVGEPAKLLEYEIGTLADYIAMLALADPGALESCAEFPTILNLLVPGCSRIATNLTEGDFAYLRGLYKTTPANTLQTQRGEMRYQMQQVLK